MEDYTLRKIDDIEDFIDIGHDVGSDAYDIQAASLFVDARVNHSANLTAIAAIADAQCQPPYSSSSHQVNPDNRDIFRLVGHAIPIAVEQSFVDPALKIQEYQEMSIAGPKRRTLRNSRYIINFLSCLTERKKRGMDINRLFRPGPSPTGRLGKRKCRNCRGHHRKVYPLSEFNE
jgi:hypothetical protein